MNTGRHKLRSIQGSVVAVTGGARGIGRATVEALANRGARCAIGDLDIELAQKTAAEICDGVVAYELDVTDRGSFTRFIDSVEQELGALDVLVNNAGIMLVEHFVEESDTDADRMIDVNLKGPILGMKIVLPRMLSRNGGHIVNIVSVAGRAPFPGGATYSASKHGVVGLSEAVRAELSGTGVKISIVMPSPVNTELASGIKAGRGIRLNEPAEVARAVVSVLERPRFEIYVPRWTKAAGLLSSIVPRAINDFVSRLVGANRVLADMDQQKRTAYDLRTRGKSNEQTD